MLVFTVLFMLFSTLPLCIVVVVAVVVDITRYVSVAVVGFAVTFMRVGVCTICVHVVCCITCYFDCVCACFVYCC